MKTITNEIDKLEVIYKNYKISENKKDLCLKFMNSKIKYILGRNEEAKELCNTLEIKYIIDDFTSQNSFEGAKIIKMQEVPNDAVVVNCLSSIYVSVVEEKLKSLGIKNIITYSDLAYLYQNKIKSQNFVKEMRKVFTNNKNNFQNVFKSFSDNYSKQIFEDILKFRLTGQGEYLSNYEVNLKEQYFANVDFFEPCDANIENAKKRLHSNKIEFINKGVSDKEEIVMFNSNNGSACNITNDGDSKIELIKLDDYINQKPDFIKMDLEGWELKALKGAEEIIKKFSPNLAIAVYHKSEDFYEIFEYIKSINPNYKIYLRHYTQGWSESVMFFVEK